MGKTYSIRKVEGGGVSSRPLKKKNECWSLFHVPPPPCLRDWLRWRCRMQKNSLKILARPKTHGNNMKTPFLSSFCLSDFRTVIRFPPKNLVPEILKLLTLVVRNCRHAAFLSTSPVHGSRSVITNLRRQNTKSSSK